MRSDSPSAQRALKHAADAARRVRAGTMSRERSESHVSSASSGSHDAVEANPAEGGQVRRRTAAGVRPRGQPSHAGGCRRAQAEASASPTRTQVLNPGVLHLHEKIYEQVEEFRHRREKVRAAGRSEAPAGAGWALNGM